MKTEYMLKNYSSIISRNSPLQIILNIWQLRFKHTYVYGICLANLLKITNTLVEFLSSH